MDDNKQFYDQVRGLLKSKDPAVNASVQKLSIEQLISPEDLRLPQSVLEQISEAIAALFNISHTSGYASAIELDDKEISHFPTKSFSALMAYDFHIDVEAESAHLIEINTNASGYIFSAIADSLRQNRGLEESLKLLKSQFITELTLAQNNTNSIAIVDEKPVTQKMYVEFLLYRALFRRWGFKCEIFDVDELKYNQTEKTIVDSQGHPIGFIYNRFCDFLLEEARSKDLRRAYLEKWVQLSPQPKEYLLLADKQRLIDLTRADFWNKINHTQSQRTAIEKVLIPSYEVSDFSDVDSIWTERKKLFFKPKNLYGGKATYRGSSISRSAFSEILKMQPIIQRYKPPGKIGDWKFDVRVFVYQDQIQLTSARLYKGQVTNFNSPNGGFASISWT